jgi:hypothetical protein
LTGMMDLCWLLDANTEPHYPPPSCSSNFWMNHLQTELILQNIKLNKNQLQLLSTFKYKFLFVKQSAKHSKKVSRHF